MASVGPLLFSFTVMAKGYGAGTDGGGVSGLCLLETFSESPAGLV